MTPAGVTLGRAVTAMAAVSSGFCLSAFCLSACGYSVHNGQGEGGHGAQVVRVTVTPAGCRPVPGRVVAGEVEIVVTNLNAPTVSEVEVRTGDFSRVVGERENLVEGLSATFDVRLEQGRYIVNCPGAVQQHWPLVVST